MNNSHRTPFILLFFTILCGIAVLCGWYWGIETFKSIIPGFISMKVNTALGLITLALSSLSLTKSKSDLYRVIGSLLAIAVLMLAVLTLSQYLFGLNFNIDEFFVTDPEAMRTKWPPGRFAPIAAINFILISIALLLHTYDSSRFVKISQGMIMIAWIASFQALIGYISGNSYSFGSAFYTQIALHTAILFIALTTSILLLWSGEGYFRHLSTQGVAGKVGRRLLFAAVIVPPLINIVQLYGVKVNLIDADFGVLLRVVGMIVCFSWMAMFTGQYLAEVDERRARAEQVKKVRTQELQKALQARDDLLSICSHELRTPISSMKLQTEFVKHQIENGDLKALSPENMAKIIEKSDQQLNRLTKLIEDMLEFSHINSGKFILKKEEFDLNALALNVLETFQTQLKANHCEVILSVDPKNPTMVYWDKRRIEQLLRNLLSNAIKYGSRKPIQINVFKKAEVTCIQVKDQGMGIKSCDFERIFEPYERAISVTKISGLGLGLHISKKIVEAHGGSINVESISDLGSTFTTVIPSKIIGNLGENLVYAG